MDINSDWESLKTQLACHYGIFYKIIEMGRPCLTNAVPTAAVQFNAEGKFINFLFNEKFWKECDEYKKMFVICHEALHIVLQHGSRFLKNVDNNNANIAMDIVVNHSLVRDFGFIREHVDAKNEYCWVDTVFKDKKYLGSSYPDDESTEFYYNELDKKQNGGGGNGDGSQGGSDSENNQSNGGGGNKLVDDHGGIKGKELEEAINKVIEELGDKEKQQLKDAISNIKNAGTESGHWFDIGKVKQLKKRKWETIIKDWSTKVLRFSEAEKEQWIRKSRRMGTFNNGLILPSNAEVECFNYSKGKINVFFFLDTSGSCINLAERFFTAANSLPKEKFDIRLFCFDTNVQETQLTDQKVYGGGGTNFSIIESHIQSEKSKTNKYPDAVFIITDGMGTKVNPEHPNKWHWFLTSDYKKFIPKNSRTYMLSDFE